MKAAEQVVYRRTNVIISAVFERGKMKKAKAETGFKKHLFFRGLV